MKETPHIINLPKFLDNRGNLSFAENNSQIPFEIARTYWIYDVPGGEIRGGHAYLDLQEFIIALSGSFTIKLNDGNEDFTFHLNSSYFGLYVPKMFWRSMENFSTNAIALVLADREYDPNQYIRSFAEFKNYTK